MCLVHACMLGTTSEMYVVGPCWSARCTIVKHQEYHQCPAGNGVTKQASNRVDCVYHGLTCSLGPPQAAPAQETPQRRCIHQCTRHLLHKSLGALGFEPTWGELDAYNTALYMMSQVPSRMRMGTGHRQTHRGTLVPPHSFLHSCGLVAGCEITSGNINFPRCCCLRLLLLWGSAVTTDDSVS